MKKLKFYLTLSLSLLLLVVPISCKKEKVKIINITDSKLKNFTVENGVLNFTSAVNFQNTINKLINNPDYTEQIKQLDFNSLSDSQNFLKASYDKTDGENELVLSDAFAVLLNDKREIIVQGILYRVCKHGTLLAYPEDRLRLNDIVGRETIEDILTPANDKVLNYSNDNPLSKFYKIKGESFKMLNENEIYLYDTYALYIDEEIIPINDESTPSLLMPPVDTTNPDYESFDVITENSTTLFGDAWDFLFGFSISREVNFDPETVVDVKFYAQNFVVYSETGIKAKTQEKGFLGIWSKIDSDELRVGWDYLEIKESRPGLFESVLTQMYNEIYSFQDPNTLDNNKWAGISKTQFNTEVFTTVDLLGETYKITNKDVYKTVVGEAWRWIKFGLSQLNDPDKPTSEEEIDGIREFSTASPQTAVTKYGLFERNAYNTDKLTFIISNDIGFIVNLTITLNNPDGSTYKPGDPGIEGIASEYEIIKASMYGCAKRDNVWKGLRLNYKYY